MNKHGFVDNERIWLYFYYANIMPSKKTEAVL